MNNQGVTIKALREKFGYSQEDLARFLGVKREMISYYETAVREVPLEILERLADLFGVDLDIFFSDNIDEAITEIAFAFRADELNKNDLESIASFRRIIKNYQRIINLEKKYA